MNWPRVTHKNPCPICGKPDWCTIAPDGGCICCMRVESRTPMRNGGWRHMVGDRPRVVAWRPIPPPPPVAPAINCVEMLDRWAQYMPLVPLTNFADSLGVSTKSIRALGAMWAREHHAWAFPMRNGAGQVVGIRLRSEDGRKWAVRGSKQGIFIPQGMPPQDVLCICEGPTDTAAALTLGLYAVGRPSCMCGGPEIIDHAKRTGVRRIVIVADNDGPGLTGAEKLAGELRMPCVMLTLPVKDMREFVRGGGTRAAFDMIVNQQIWRVWRG